jgi:ABC-type transporter Mla MlaB component
LAAPEEPPATSVLTLGPRHESKALVLILSASVARPDIARLCANVQALLEDGNAEVIVCDVSRVKVDAAVVDALCRLQLTARRAGRRLHVRHASCELRILLAWTGLAEVLPGSGELRVQPGREAEYGEQARGVEKERDAGDPAP